MAIDNLVREAATQEHCRQLAPYMKAADVRELRASGLNPLEALEASLDLSEGTSAFVLGGKVVAISGVAALPRVSDPQGESVGTTTCGTATCGIVWALTVPLSGWKKAFWKMSQELILEYQRRFLLLTNFCDVENTETIRYLKKLGFVFIRREEQFGVGRKPFYQFVRIR